MRKQLTVIKALFFGCEVKINGSIYKLFGPSALVECPTSIIELGDNQFFLGIKGTKTNAEMKEPINVWLKYDVPFIDFLSQIEDITEDDYSILCANIALKEINK